MENAFRTWNSGIHLVAMTWVGLIMDPSVKHMIIIDQTQTRQLIITKYNLYDMEWNIYGVKLHQSFGVKMIVKP